MGDDAREGVKEISHSANFGIDSRFALREYPPTNTGDPPMSAALTAPLTLTCDDCGGEGQALPLEVRRQRPRRLAGPLRILRRLRHRHPALRRPGMPHRRQRDDPLADRPGRALLYPLRRAGPR